MGETQSGNMGGDTAAADALAALQTPDPRSLSWFVGGAMAPEDAAAYQQRVMAQFDVPASVPETVTKSFDRLRAIYQQALLCYDLYTVAGDHARLVAEQALRERFVEFYGGTILFTDGQGKPQTVPGTTFDEVYWGIRGTDGRPKRWTIQLRSGRKGFEFTGGMASHSTTVTGRLDGALKRAAVSPSGDGVSCGISARARTPWPSCPHSACAGSARRMPMRSTITGHLGMPL